MQRVHSRRKGLIVGVIVRTVTEKAERLYKRHANCGRFLKINNDENMIYFPCNETTEDRDW